MNHLDYEGTEEDLTVIINSEDGSTVREVTVNSVLLRMLSPWWKSKLASSGFMDEVINGRCTILCESPTVTEFALNAARLRVKQSDLVSKADLDFTFQLWQQADMWQFGYLADLCQGALQELLTGEDAETLKSFVTAALEHSSAILEAVVVPFFIANPTKRSHAVYLAFEDKSMLRLAEVAAIAGFQNCTKFLNRLADYAETCADAELVQYLQCNPEARARVLYSKQSFERCMLLFAAAPLPFVKDMVGLAVESSWTPEQKKLVMSAIDFNRVTGCDQNYLSQHHKLLPQQVYVYQALWKCTQRMLAHPEASMASSAPWAIACSKDHYGTDTELRNTGPIKFMLKSTRQAIFYCKTNAYGILESRGPGVVLRAGMPFTFCAGDTLVVYVSPDAVIQRAWN